jgi:hypothetical protein
MIVWARLGGSNYLLDTYIIKYIIVELAEHWGCLAPLAPLPPPLVLTVLEQQHIHKDI